MIIPIVQVFKELFVQQSMTELATQVTSEAVGELITSYKETSDELSSQKIGILDIESDTWYIFHMADEGSWREGFRKWADILNREIPRRYFFAKGAGESALPFAVKVADTDQGMEIRFDKLMGTTQGIDRGAIFNVVHELVRDTVKAYVRCVATGGQSFPEDY
jgi:hypothetical protein